MGMMMGMAQFMAQQHQQQSPAGRRSRARPQQATFSLPQQPPHYMLLPPPPGPATLQLASDDDQDAAGEHDASYTAGPSSFSHGASAGGMQYGGRAGGMQYGGHGGGAAANAGAAGRYLPTGFSSALPTLGLAAPPVPLLAPQPTLSPAEEEVLVTVGALTVHAQHPNVARTALRLPPRSALIEIGRQAMLLGKGLQGH